MACRAVCHGRAARRGRGQSSRQFSNFQGNCRLTQQLPGSRYSAALHEAPFGRRSATMIRSKTWINTYTLSSKCLWREKLVKLRSKIACCGVDHSYGCGLGGILYNKLKKKEKKEKGIFVTATYRETCLRDKQRFYNMYS